MYFATRGGYVEAVEVVLDAGAAVDIKDEDRSTLLHHAARGSHTAVVRELLAAGAAGDKESPLHLAARGSYTAVVAALLLAEVEVDEASENEQTPLHSAVNGLLAETVRHLLVCGAALNAGDAGERGRRWTWRLGAATCGSYGCCWMLALRCYCRRRHGGEGQRGGDGGGGRQDGDGQASAPSSDRPTVGRQT